MGSFKQLKSSDVITVPVIANRTWNFNYCPLPSTDPYISVYNGTNYTNSFDPGNEPSTNTHYDRLTYRQINQLFYHQYSGSLNTASLASSIHYLSASSQHPSASFFNYNNDPAFISYFPTGANETIKVIQISPDAYGNKVLPYSFQMSSSQYSFYDDGKGNIFEGVAPGQVKGIAIKVLRGFRESLDDAVNSGVAGAEDLAKARDKFKGNLQKIEEYSNYPLTKYFDVETPSALTPELVIDRLSKAKPTERLFLSQVLANSPDANMILDTVRRSQLEALLSKSQKAASGAAEGAPTIDLKTLLTEINNKKGDFNYLFPNAADKADATLAIQWLQKNG